MVSVRTQSKCEDLEPLGSWCGISGGASYVFDVSGYKYVVLQIIGHNKYDDLYFRWCVNSSCGLSTNSVPLSYFQFPLVDSGGVVQALAPTVTRLAPPAGYKYLNIYRTGLTAIYPVCFTVFGVR